ncbi:aminoacyl-histidine dipeptidase [Anaerotignum sp.]|uniref:aminoacyl-histidine dipeptidase n=1 Tax=Anaerotignum sp. TaxID=2039241 RepID=UPI003324AC3E
MSKLNGLGGDKVFYYFEEICKIPHGSENEMALSNYIAEFAKERGLYCRQDEHYNVLIKKPGSKGYENVAPMIIQGHIDMVCEKNAGTDLDFLTDPIQIYVKDDFIHAEGTTLGADNGIAVAYMLALLDDNTLEHPPLEAIFTVEEEIGMGGARTFETFDVEGKRFLNMDTEEEGVLLSGCAGGCRVRVYLPTQRKDSPEGKEAFQIAIHGLKGGHSGADIHLQRASANRLIGRVLFQLGKEVDYLLASVDGGNMDNAICREAEAIVLIDQNNEGKVRSLLAKIEKDFQVEYKTSETSITITMEALKEKVFKVLTNDTKSKVVSLLMLLPYGVQTMSMEMQGLVESSSNIGILKTTSDHIYFDNAVRSSIESRKALITQKIESVASLCGASVECVNDYPGWRFNPDSPLLKLFAKCYGKMFGKEATISAIHAGLECGLFSEKIPNLDMVSIGPEMYDVHTPDERLSISSTIRVWEFLKEVLKQMDH